VVLLVDVEEFSYKDASVILSVPIGTVMSRLSRGRKLLRERLAETAKSYGILHGPLDDPEEGRSA
jgi:RNA polymerase sigma-70 factor (ECF subfamily)